MLKPSTLRVSAGDSTDILIILISPCKMYHTAWTLPRHIKLQSVQCLVTIVGRPFEKLSTTVLYCCSCSALCAFLQWPVHKQTLVTLWQLWRIYRSVRRKSPVIWHLLLNRIHTMSSPRHLHLVNWIFSGKLHLDAIQEAVVAVGVSGQWTLFWFYFKQSNSLHW